MAKLAFVFPGQGTQHTGMGQELCSLSPAAAEVFAKADAIRPGTSTQCFSATKDELTLTANTQPCMFCADYAAAAALAERGIRPDYLAGFSLGEVPALAFGGYLSFEDAFRYVCRRAELMAMCAEKSGGSMFAVMGLSSIAVEEICAEIDGTFPVNYNSPAQTVVACREDAGAALAAAVKARKGKALKLAVGGGFHSPMMDGASAGLADEFSSIQFEKPAIPVISNLTAREYEAPSQMFLQVNSPVRWQDTVQYLISQGVDTFVEVGPGKALSGLIGKISAETAVLRVENQETLNTALEVFKNA